MNITDIKNPSFLKDLTIPECEALSADIRAFLIENLSKTGGHFSSNLGVVELTIALHKVFESPKDKFIFDVGHQGYVHKILTGRANQFESLRQMDGLSGFLKRDESKHDVYESGHSSTSIAAQAGMLFAKPFNQDMRHVIALIGDGALASGSALEALNFLGHYPEKNPIIILNDNEMSISENVGYLARALTKMRMRRSYRSLRRKTSRLIPKPLKKFTSKIEKRVKGFLTGTTYFESMGYQYYGPLNGHDFKQLLKVFQTVKNNPAPTVIHLRTVKGKGYEHAENDTLGAWHGTPPFEIETGRQQQKDKPNAVSFQAITADYMSNRAQQDPSFHVITPAMSAGASLTSFKAQHPTQLIDTGIAEATALTMATAMGLNRVKPFLTIYSTFLQRAYDQLIHDLARQKANVVIGIDRAGLVGADGETHQGIYDIPMMMHIPNLTIAHPKDGKEMLGLYAYAFEHHNGPIAIRYPKAKTAFDQAWLTNPIKPIKPSWEIVHEGQKATLIAFGDVVPVIEARMKQLKLPVRLINARYIKPLSESMLQMIHPDQPLIIHEESVKSGGLGSEILRKLIDLNRLPNHVKHMGFDDAFIPQGDRLSMLNRYELDVHHIIQVVKDCLDET